MAEFCKCGSLIIAGRCSNKGCSFKVLGPEDALPVKKAGRTAEKAPAKSTKTRRASKCITYNLYDTEEKEGNS